MDFYNPPWDSGAINDVIAEYKGKFYRVLPQREGFSASDTSDDPLLDRLGLPQDVSEIYDEEAIAAMESAVLQESKTPIPICSECGCPLDDDGTCPACKEGK